MSTIDAENHYTIGHRHQGPRAHDLFTGPMDRTGHNGASVSSPTESLISPLQPFTYDPSAANLERYASNASINGGPSCEDGSPNPHDFYRRYQDPFSGVAEGQQQADLLAQKGDVRMTTSREIRRPNPSQIRTNGTKFPSLSSRMPNGRASPTADKSVLSAARSTPNFSNTPRNRQTSLKDLVNRFNQTPDEVPPVPSKTQSRSTSTNSNPPANNHARARTASQSKPQPSPGQTPKRRGRTVEESHTGRVTSPRARRSTADELTSQSMTDSSPTSGGAPRKPLFGEIVLQNINNLKPGYGIPAPRRRRGSEGSMHSPNPMFPDERKASTQTPPPSSPSAWYRVHAPTLEEIKQDKAIPEMPPTLHRRTRSDFTGIPAVPPTRSYNAFLANPDDAPQSSTAYSSTRRESQSRIPLSSRRLSITSDSGNSTPSTRTNSALGRRNPTHIMSPSKGPRVLPFPSQRPRSPTANSQRPASRKSPRRGDIARDTQRISTSPRLAAFISAPLPKKSPPLRSSRPRQPVSTATTSASRARAVDRYENGGEKSPSKSAKEYKNRRPPELGGVDFAARREKIQRAFTKSVRAEEKRRASVAQETQARAQAQESNVTGDGAQESFTEQDDICHDPEANPSQDLRNSEEDIFQTPGEEMPRTERELTINTGHLSERSVLDLSQEDSPTLGIVGRFGHLNRASEGDTTPTSDIEPSSAVTAGTSDSVDTFFDDEPQEDEEDVEVPGLEPEQEPNQPESRTLLSHIMTMRDRSPESPTTLHHPPTVEETSFERDDRESIQIMLGETPVLEKPPNLQQVQEESPYEIFASNAPGSRWSVSSWSSMKSKDNDREGPMDRIDEHSPPPLRAKDPGHLSSSTVTSELTQQPWSPTTFTSPQTERSTMDSDAYSTINRVLDHYHDPNVVSPKMMHEVQQHIFTQSPDLARQGGWDPKKVTQLYLQQLARERALSRGSSLPDPYKYRRKPINLQSPTSVPRVEEKEKVEETEKILRPTESASHSRNASLDVDDGDFTLTHRASMNHPDDWAMSPSIADWIAPQAEDSPSDERAPDPPKSWEDARQELAAMDTPKSSGTYRPQLPEIKGTEPLGLAINITSPQEDDSPTIPPPLPDHVPPPPPTESPVDDLFSPPTAHPSMTSSNADPKSVPSNVAQSRYTAEVPSLPNHSSNDSSRRSGTTISSLPPSNSSFSQERSSAGTQITSSETVKLDPAEQKRLTKRRHVIRELVDTEHSFGQDMKVVDDIYKGTSNVIIISAEDVKTLFSNSDQIVAFSTQFLDALKQASRSVYVLPKSKRWRSNRESNMTTNSLGTDDQSSLHGPEMSDEDKDRRTFIGEAFGHHMAQMERVYSEYLKNHDAANQKLQMLQKNEKVQIWLKECRAYAHDLTTAWDLDSLLVKPVQRILKYPLLLDQLLEATPENHPDFAQLDIAAREMKGISMRINEMKKRADIMEQVTNTRKRKESDVRIGLSKAFGRRTEKLRQQVGLSDMVEDSQYSAVSEKFGSHFFQLQVVMRDVEMYTNDVQTFMRRFLDFSHAMEEHIEVAQTSYPESESKWRKFRMSMTEMTVTALTDHVNAVRKNVIEPMTTLLKLHDGPQKLMQKRNKRVMDYARYRAIKDRGDKLDKKTAEQGEQFIAVNDTLKEELPKLFSLTGKLVEACLNNFIQLQLQWQAIWKRKLAQAVDDIKPPSNSIEIISAFTGDFQFVEAQVLSLGICNGAMLADAANLVGLLSPTTTMNSEDMAASRQTPSTDYPKQRTTSVSSDMSPVLPRPDFGGRENGSFFGNMTAGSSLMTNVETRRMRASSAVSQNNSPQTPDIPGSYRSYSNCTTPSNPPPPRRPNTATGRSSLQSPSFASPSVDNPDYARMSDHTAPFVNRPPSGQTYPQVAPPRSSSPTQRYSGLFSSALPMSDSPRTESPVEVNARRDFKVLFLAASVYEFNIDRARREAGYPYLTYVAGEIFDVIGEKGELWLAKNQDDATCQVGWIWNKHFVKLAS